MPRKTPLTPDQIQRIRDLHAAGESYRAIAELVDTTISAVHYHLRVAPAHKADWRTCRALTLKNWHGISFGEFEAQLTLQDGKCAVCGDALSLRDARVDHDHNTDRLRGLTHDICNRGLGYFHDLPRRMRQGATYLEQGGCWGRTPPPAPATETVAYPLTYAWVEDE